MLRGLAASAGKDECWGSYEWKERDTSATKCWRRANGGTKG